ncbi:MAG: hypothetical protein IKH45_02875 [Neisseriaceae bacterium]|nr:hypothetical protein [Neisseriaceae bacterium]MBR3481815.1 hypothetical protein [Neisseriaceae bacterium]
MSDNNEMFMNVISQLLQGESNEKIQEYKEQIFKRIAEETDVKPTRIPAPLNITEVGGYFNLIQQVQTANDPSLEKQKARMQLALIASALGLPM